MPRRGLRWVLLLPLTLSWRFVTMVANMMGILLTLLAGTALLMIGLLLCSTFIGFFVGAPMVFFGGLLLLRGLY